jgi:import inner membrane translocase subunit TIM23
MFDYIIVVCSGIDPLVLAGISGVVCGGIGYVVGGMLMEAVWHLFNTQQSRQLKEREADFLARISKHRAATNNRYEDDYYGESVKTLSDYRQWVRRQQRLKEGKLTNVDDKPSGSAF